MESNPFFEQDDLEQSEVPVATTSPATQTSSNPFDDQTSFQSSAFSAEDVFGKQEPEKVASKPALPPKPQAAVATESTNFFAEAAFSEKFDDKEIDSPAENEAKSKSDKKNKKKKKEEKERIAPLPTASMNEESSSDYSSNSDSESESESESDTEDEEQQEQKKKKKDKKKKFHCRYLFRLKFYQQFFKVETMDVFKRMLWNIFPFGENFLKRISPNQDLYGPFWITTTAIFLLTLVSSCVKWGSFSSENSENQYTYDWSKIVVTLVIFYVYLLPLPFVIWLAGKYFGAELKFIDYICAYGYSFTIYLPLGLLCLISYEWVLWILVMTACAVSTLSLIFSFWSPFSEQLYNGPRLGLVIAIAVFHVCLGFFLKLYLFMPAKVKSSK